MRRFTSSAFVATSKPATRAVPAVGCSRPISIRIAVVFPAPLAPRNPKTSPLLTVKEIRSTAVKSPNFRVRSFTSMAMSLTPPPRSGQ